MTEQQQREISELQTEGQLKEIDGKYEEAIKCYDKALEINPYAEEILGSKGAALAGLGKYDKAIEYYDKALEVNPQSLFLFNKALAFEKQEKYKEALECCNKYLEIDSGKLDESHKMLYDTYAEDMKARKKWYEDMKGSNSSPDLSASSNNLPQSSSNNNISNPTENKVIDENSWEQCYYRYKELMKERKIEEALKYQSKAIKLALDKGESDKLEALFQEDRSDALKKGCNANLKNIATGLEMYSIDNGCFPDRLDDLLKPSPEFNTPYMSVIPNCVSNGKEQAYVYKKISNNSYKLTCPNCGIEVIK